MADSIPTSPTSQALLSLISFSSSLSTSTRLYLSNEDGEIPMIENTRVAPSKQQITEATGARGTDEGKIRLARTLGGIVLDEELTSFSSIPIPLNQQAPRSLPSSPSKGQPRSIETLRAEIQKLKATEEFYLSAKDCAHRPRVAKSDGTQAQLCPGSHNAKKEGKDEEDGSLHGGQLNISPHSPEESGKLPCQADPPLMKTHVNSPRPSQHVNKAFYPVHTPPLCKTIKQNPSISPNPPGKQ